MVQVLLRWSVRLGAVAVAALLAVTGFTVAKDKGLLSPFGIDSEGQDTQVIQAVTRTQEVSLLRLAVEGINQEKQDNADLLGIDIPGTGRVTFVRYSFGAKLGIDGEDVNVTKTGESAYLVSIPEFIVIGYDKPSFETAVEDDGIISWTTPEIDKFEMVNEVFNEAAQQKYLEQHRAELKDQAEVFYSSLITSIDPAAQTTFEFEG
ncbi:hypothetical protein GCM10023168_14200 [Fodinibacter luteus]|uniref:DUF4230 domain-containing protein n=1 Tax=Fodinibacter luteus TaxID=552064 RepID=A0ABP8KB05_9MICO